MNTVSVGSVEHMAVKAEILSKFGVVSSSEFDASEAVAVRLTYLKQLLRHTGRHAFVLGISGGVDSCAVGKLCQLACTQLSTEGYPAKFVAMRLPAGVQFDEAHAQMSLEFIKPDVVLTVDIGPAATDLSARGCISFRRVGGSLTSEQIDFNKGNIKARLRMVAQYQASAMFNGLVVGTDHNAECVMGFFTLFGDGACDLTVLNGLNKRQVRAVAKQLGAPEELWSKPPTADLEELKPGKLDDEGFGFDYKYLDDFLEGLHIPMEVEQKIINRYLETSFKRAPIPGFYLDGQ